MPPPPPLTQQHTISHSTTFLISCAFFIALFPGLFHTVIWSPYHYALNYAFPPAPQDPTYRTNVYCQSPSICVDEFKMSWTQKTLTLPPSSRGSYLITEKITTSLPELVQIKTGLLTLFIQHTSCALSLNENWDEDVRADMSDALDRIVPEDKNGAQGLYRHDAEGSDDMPAHVKSALVGASVTVPITDGRLALGTWQGIWYLEFRRARHTRKVVATIQGEKM